MPYFVPKSASVPLTTGQLKEVFKKNDADGDGRLTKQELKKAFEQLGSRNPNWRVHRAFRHADNNKDGSISLEELDELVKNVVNLGYCIG
ncbi:hypothetical protein Patl1_08971 [Pistacia atlantica]|uniref:Uncharacterized protein n=1 Tax=Pistacia atlantica TaxID=434234 RepID=A0ACC1AFB6_9ROSI|nr:hypothetical protein Patl1_08971 [Pistacia atlantica]